MKTLKELLEERGKLKGASDAILETARSESRDLTDDEHTKFDQTMDAVEAMKPTIDRLCRHERITEDMTGTTLDRIPRDAPTSQAVATADDDPAPMQRDYSRIVIPSRAYRVQRLRNFTGPDAEQRAFAFGMWALAALRRNRAALEWCMKHEDIIEKRALTEGTDTAGGYLVPQIALPTIIDLRETYGVFRRESKVVAMGSDSITISRRTGGLTAYAVGEGDTITESDKTWNRIQLVAHKWATLTRWSSELDQDAIISIADDLAGEIAYAFSNKEDEAGFNGDGTSTYHGAWGAMVRIDDGNHTASIYDAASGNTAFSTLDLVDFEGACGTLPQYAEANAKWFVSKAGFWASMARLADAAGGNTRDDIAGGAHRQFLGYPVVFSQVLNSTLTAQASTVLCLFGDLRMATTFGDRRGVAIKIDESKYFDTDEIAIRGTTRFDVNCHDLGDTSSAGPLIGLKTPAS